MLPKPNARIAVDIGGTFTDIAFDYRSSLFTAKTLTTQQDPVGGGVEARWQRRQERKP